jgi:hypothetical protein
MRTIRANKGDDKATAAGLGTQEARDRVESAKTPLGAPHTGAKIESTDHEGRLAGQEDGGWAKGGAGLQVPASAIDNGNSRSVLC